MIALYVFPLGSIMKTRNVPVEQTHWRSCVVPRHDRRVPVWSAMGHGAKPAGARPWLCLLVILVVCQTRLAAAPGDESLVWSVPRLAAAPALDGRARDREWAAAAVVTGFTEIGKPTLARLQPTARLGFDRQALYIFITVPRPSDAPLKCEAVQRDGPVWADDSVEVFLALGNAPYRHVIINARNVVYDEIGKRGSSWDGAWRSATHIAPDHWNAELRFPWSDLGIRKPPTAALHANLCWNRHGGGTGAMTWAPVQADYHEPEHFAELRLAAAAPALQYTELSFATTGPPRWKAALSTGKARLRLRLCSRTGEEILSREYPVDGEARLVSPVTDKPPPPGIYRLFYRCDTIATGSFGFEILPPFDWTITPRLLAGEVDVAVDLKRLQKPAGARVRLCVFSAADGKLVRRVDLPPAGKVTLPTAALPVGHYRIEAEVLDPEGRVIAKRTDGRFRRPRRPPWLHYDGGRSRDVLPPWSPVRVDRSLTLRVQGRSYAMPNGFLPAAIRIHGREVLARPIALAAKVNGKTCAWTFSPGTVKTSSTDKVEVLGRMDSAAIRIEGRAVVEYDGMIDVVVRVVPRLANPTVSLTLDIPLTAETTEYLYTFPGVWGSTRNAGALPPQGWQSAFLPYVWLGDNDGGLAWFCESAKDWHPKHPEQALTITRSPKTTLLRIHLLEDTVLKQPKQYEFGLQATPVKTPPHDAWDYRILRIGSYGLEKKSSNRWNTQRVAWPGRGNIDLRRGSLDMWVRPDFEPIAGEPGPDLPKGLTLFYAFTEAPGIRRQSIDLFWDRFDHEFKLYAAVGRRPTVVRKKLASFPCPNWKKGQWRRIGLTWGRKFTLWVDGRPADTRDFSGLFPEPLEAFDTALDNTWLCLITNPVAIDELAIAGEPRNLAEALTAAGKPRAGLLFAEAFDGRLQTTPGMRVNATCRPTPGTAGQAILLYNPMDASPIDEMAALGCKTIVFHESWSNIQNSGIPADPRGLRSLVRACHRNGMQLLLYFGFEMSDAHPDWDVFHHECLQVCADSHAVPSRQQAYNRRKPPQHAWHVCYHSPWADYLAWSVAKLMDDYDIDGVYLDGTEYLFPCSNPYHGCGYTGADGKRHDTYPIFAVRDLMKRLYTIVKTRKPNGQINAHSSTCLLAPTIAWATSLWDGEQIAGCDLRQTHFSEIIPLDTFRTEFMGRNQGVPSEFLAYGIHNQHRALAFTLLHDVIVRLDNDHVLAGKLWAAMADFGRQKAQWLPYWSNADAVAVAPGEVKVSLYSRREQGLLLVVSNLGRKEVEARITPHGKNLGFGSAVWTARDALTRAVPVLENGTLRLPLQSMEWRLLRLTPTAADPPRR